MSERDPMGRHDMSEYDRRFKAIDDVEGLAEPSEPIRKEIPTPATSSEHPDQWATEELEWGYPEAIHGDGVI